MFMCLCKGLRDSDVRRVAREGCIDPDGLIEALGLEDDECCGKCALMIDDFVAIAERELVETRLKAVA